MTLKELLDYLAETAPKAPSPPLEALLEELRARFPNLGAVLFYGSCLQEENELEGLVDLYALVDRYARAYRSRALALANWLLPPNVFYLERALGGGLKVRSKYAVMALWQFERATGPTWFHSYFWGRFAQPAALIWWRDETRRKRTLRALAQAVVTFLTEVTPCAPPQGTLKDLWLSGLRLSYRAELRPEPPARLERLWEKNQDHFLAVTEKAASALPFRLKVSGHTYEAQIDETQRRRAALRWRLRIPLGKGLSVLRLLKACFTFQGGVDYALWKIERHTGKRLNLPAPLRQHPLLAFLFYGWRVLLTKGVR